MKPPPLPPDEPARLASLSALNILDTPMEERFERITRMARRSFNVPIATITLIDAERQWFKSAQGLAVNQTPREVSFCGHAILEKDPMVVPDATNDPRFSDNPLVTGDPSIRFYAGCPVHSPDGSTLGTLCLIDRSPRALDQQDLVALKDLAQMVEEELQRKSVNASHAALLSELDNVRLRAAIDPLTRLWNRGAITEMLARERAQTLRDLAPLAVIFIDFDFFKKVNDSYGHAAGDAVLREGAARLNQVLRPMDALGRYGGEEMIGIIPGCSLDEVGEICERLRRAIADQPIAIPGGAIACSVSIGVGYAAAGDTTGVDPLLAIADAALYRAKSGGRNRVESGVAGSGAETAAG